MVIERELHELLYAHDCVIVPQFGGFLTHYRPARVDEQRQLVHPPAKDLSFNRHLVRNDGLLTDRVSRRESVDFDRANAMIDSAVADWRQRLQRDGRLELPQIGVFYRNAEQSLQFEPDPHANYHRDSYGLRPLKAVPVPVVKPLPLPTPRTVEISEPTAGARSRWMWAAAGVSALAIGAVAWLLSARSPALRDPQWSALVPWEQEEAKYSARQGRKSIDIASTGDAETEFVLPESEGIVNVPLFEHGPEMVVDLGMQPVEAAVDSTAVAIPASVAVNSGKYHVIGGCFSVKENADRLVDDLKAKGFAAYLLDEHKGLYRVAYGTFPQRAAALEALAAVRKAETAHAWLLIK